MGLWPRFVLVLGVATWGACAPQQSQSPPPAQASTPAGDTAPAGDGDGLDPHSTPAELPLPEPMDPKGVDRVDDAEGALHRAEVEFDEAFRQVGSDTAGKMASGRCDRLCSSVGSMSRAVDALCELTGDDDERCEAARRRLESATRRVSGAGCGCSSVRH